MSAETWAFAGYLLWLAAGRIDFACHVRTDLAATSGLRESRMHLVQVALIGAGALAWLMLRPTWASLTLISLLVAAHAVVGYLDTRSAWGRRAITPLEQHVHSVLDLAPWIALGVVFHAHREYASTQGWTWAVRDPALPLSTWSAVLLPALLLCVAPLLREWRAAWRARAGVGGPQQA